MLCKYADISRSGYYTWKKRQRNLEINSKELQDRHDFELILNIYNHRKDTQL